MKKLSVLALAVFLVACGDDKPAQQQVTAAPAAVQAAPVQQPAPQVVVVQQPAQQHSSGVGEALAGAAVGYMVGSALSRDNSHPYYNDRDHRYYSTPQDNRTVVNKTVNVYNNTPAAKTTPTPAPSYAPAPTTAYKPPVVQTKSGVQPVSGTAAPKPSINLTKSAPAPSAPKPVFKPTSAKK